LVSNALVDLLQFDEEFTVFVHDSLVKSSQKGHKDECTMCLSILGLPHNNIFRLELKVNILELIEKCHVVNTKGPHKHGLLVGLGTQNSGGVKKHKEKVSRKE
jgi:hypothetical protein